MTVNRNTHVLVREIRDDFDVADQFVRLEFVLCREIRSRDHSDGRNGCRRVRGRRRGLGDGVAGAADRAGAAGAVGADRRR